MVNLLYLFLINGLILTEPPFLNKWRELSFELEGNYQINKEKNFSPLLSTYLGLPLASEFSFDLSYEEEFDFLLYLKKGFSLPFIDMALRGGISLKGRGPLLIFSVGKDLKLFTLYGGGGFSYEHEEKDYAKFFGFALEKEIGNLSLGSEFYKEKYKEKEDKIVTLGLSYSLSIVDVYFGIRRNCADGFIFNLGISKNFSF